MAQSEIDKLLDQHWTMISDTVTSALGEWKKQPLSRLVKIAEIKDTTRYIVDGVAREPHPSPSRDLGNPFTRDILFRPTVRGFREMTTTLRVDTDWLEDLGNPEAVDQKKEKLRSWARKAREFQPWAACQMLTDLKQIRAPEVPAAVLQAAQMVAGDRLLVLSEAAAAARPTEETAARWFGKDGIVQVKPAVLPPNTWALLLPRPALVRSQGFDLRLGFEDPSADGVTLTLTERFLYHQLAGPDLVYVGLQ